MNWFELRVWTKVKKEGHNSGVFQPPMLVISYRAQELLVDAQQLILTWRGSKPDQRGASSRARLFHCTLIRLTPAITPNVGNSTVQFVIVGTCVRASPLQSSKKHFKKPNNFTCEHYVRTYRLAYRYTYLYVCNTFHLLKAWRSSLTSPL